MDCMAFKSMLGIYTNYLLILFIRNIHIEEDDSYQKEYDVLNKYEENFLKSINEYGEKRPSTEDK